MGTDPKNLLGTTLSGRYRIDKAIGEGGMGAIFQATQLSLGRSVAIKVVKCMHEDASDAVRRFELETEVIARLAHPNIVQVVDAGKADDGTMYLAMELLEGDSVRGVLRKIGTVPVPRALAIVEDIASALAAAHAGGVIHRDLKAENVMLVRAAGKQEIAKVLDFGVAKLTTKTEAPPQTGSGFVAGTPGCIAPEQMLGKSDEPRSDLYSVGVLLFEMLAGEPPFVASSSVELMMRHLTEPPPRVADVARARGKPEVPGPIDELVASLLAKDPEARPKSAEALVEIVASLRDASRSTQPDLRLPTPLGGFAVPTPGSVSLPVPGQNGTPMPIVNLPPSTPTAPTTAVPVPPAAQAQVATELVARQRPPLKKVLTRVAALAASIFVVMTGMWLYEAFRDRPIPGVPWLERESWRRYNQMDEALLNLDTALVKSHARFLLQEKGHEVPMAYLFLAHVAMLERQPLSVIDGFQAQARASAERRAKASMGSVRHTELLVDALTESDIVKAQQKWDLHVQNGGCTDAWVEEHMFLHKQAYTEIDGQRIVDVFAPIVARYEEHAYPLALLGLARGHRKLGDVAKAEQMIAPLLAQRPLNPVLIDAMVDLDLDKGDERAALARIEKRLAEEDEPRLAMRRAVIMLRTDARAFEGMRHRLQSLPDANPAKASGLGYLGYALAARGQLTDADELGRAARAAAVGPDAPMRIAEMAVFASMYAAVIGDEPLAQRWLDEYQDVRDGLLEGPTARRVKAVALGNRIMLAANDDMRSMADGGKGAVRDFEWLRAESIDIPLLTQTIDWHVQIAQGKVEEAKAVADKLPRCWKEIHLGMSYAMARDFKPAVEYLKEGTTDAMIKSCTSGDDVVAFIQSVEVAKALGFLATAACMRGDRALAAESVKRLRAFWPHASSPSADASWLAYVTSVEASLTAAPGTVGCLPPKVAARNGTPTPTPSPP